MNGYSFREKKIEELENKLKGIAKTLKMVNRMDMVKLFCEVEKELEIQKAYLAHE